MAILVQTFWGEKNSAEFVFGYFKTKNGLSGWTTKKKNWTKRAIFFAKYCNKPAKKTTTLPTANII